MKLMNNVHNFEMSRDIYFFNETVAHFGRGSMPSISFCESNNTYNS